MVASVKFSNHVRHHRSVTSALCLQPNHTFVSCGYLQHKKIKEKKKFGTAHGSMESQWNGMIDLLQDNGVVTVEMNTIVLAPSYLHPSIKHTIWRKQPWRYQDGFGNRWQGLRRKDIHDTDKGSTMVDEVGRAGTKPLLEKAHDVSSILGFIACSKWNQGALLLPYSDLPASKSTYGSRIELNKTMDPSTSTLISAKQERRNSAIEQPRPERRFTWKVDCSKRSCRAHYLQRS